MARRSSKGRGLTRSFAMPAGTVTALGDVSIRVDAMRLRGDHGTIWLRQVDAPAHPRLRRSAEHRFSGLRGTRRPHAHRVGAQPHPADANRLRLPAVLSAADAHCLENIELPQAEAGATKSERRARTRELLDYVGLADRARSPPVAAVGRRDAARGDRVERWQTGRPCCSPTSRPASSTTRPACKSPRCSIACTPTAPRSSSSPTIRRSPRGAGRHLTHEERTRGDRRDPAAGAAVVGHASRCARRCSRAASDSASR